MYSFREFCLCWVLCELCFVESRRVVDRYRIIGENSYIGKGVGVRYR